VRRETSTQASRRPLPIPVVDARPAAPRALVDFAYTLRVS